MTHTKNAGPTLNQWLDRLGKPPQKNMESASERVWQALLSDAGETQDSVLLTPPPDAKPVKFRSLRLPMLAVAAAVVVLIALTPMLMRNVALRTGGMQAVVVEGALVRVDGEKSDSLQPGQRIARGERIRSIGDKGAMIALADGSRVEMRSGTELALERADDGVRIQLNTGGIIVNAAKQRQGHLYVQTNDITVSVVGTVFLVNAEEEGSQVAVIEGEVRVQRGATEQKLQRGEQVSTGPLMEPRPVKEEISWSQYAEEHAALLQQSDNAPDGIKAGSVTGVVRSSDGYPAAGTRVAALRTDAADATLRAMASLAETDTAGRYRLESVPPGSYYITAGRVDLPTYYPGTLEIGKGLAVSISSAATVSDIDFVLQDTSVALPPEQHFSGNRKVVLRVDTSFTGETPSPSSRRRVGMGGTVGSQVVNAWWTDTDLWARLGVTADQQKRIIAIAQPRVPVVVQKKADFENAEAALKRMLASESKDAAAEISSQNERVLRLRRDWEDADSEMIQEMLQVLAESQRTQLQTEMPQLRGEMRKP